MDPAVQQALKKWPNVPHCYGWLALDARGHWRMRDEATQHANLPGDIIRHLALCEFINRNYDRDDNGAWFFQNGPQRVYVDLATTPHIAQLDAAGAIHLHTGEALHHIERVLITEQGQLILFQPATADHPAIVAMVNDRDLAPMLEALRFADGHRPDYDFLADYFSDAPDQPTQDLFWSHQTWRIRIERCQLSDLPLLFHYQPQPRI